MTTDVMGNIINASDSVGGTPVRRYAYDALYRLTRADNANNVMQEDYGYNKTGDRTLKQFAGQAAQVYGYGATSHRLASVAGVSRSYDANGNTLTLPDLPYPAEYDDRNRLASVTQDGLGTSTITRYTHNGKGERVLKLSTGNDTTTRIFVYDENGRLLRERADRTCGGGSGSRLMPTAGQIACGGNRTVELLYVDDMPVAQITDGVISYLETDHLGTPRVAANPANNAWQWKWNFFGDAFGGNATQTNSSGGIEVSLRYPGQQFDAESGLHYNYLRDYEAGAGRYVESDPIGFLGGLSTYAYVFDSPLMAIDPLGLKARVCCKQIPMIGLFGKPNHCYVEIQAGDDSSPITSYGLVGGTFSGEPYATGNIYIDNPFDSSGNCGDWSDYDGCDECVVSSSHSYANPSDYHYLNGSNSNSFAGNVSRQCKLRKPDINGTAPRWGAPPASQRPGTRYTPPNRYDGGR